MRSPVLTFGLLVMATVVLCGTARAQSTEDRLREALRKSVVDLRAAQDGLGAVQAQLDQTTKQRDALQKQVDELTAKLSAAPEAAPAPIGPSPQDAAELDRLREEAQARDAQLRAAQAALSKWQGAYQEAATVARARDGEARQNAAIVKQAEATLNACKTANVKLAAVANDILHLYRTQDFRHILLGSYEPLLGLKEVELQNIVQDYEDKIRDQHFTGAAVPAPAPTVSAAPARAGTGR